MGTEKTNKLKIVLVKQGKTGKWLARQLEKKTRRPFHSDVPMQASLLWKC